MFRPGSIQSHLTFKDKIFSLDLYLFFSILTIGFISFFAMYSTDGGEFAYHTKSHIVRFFVFFLLFIIVSFLKLNFWYNSSTFFYLGILFFRFTEMARSLFYKFATIGANESGLDFIFSKILPQNFSI